MLWILTGYCLPMRTRKSGCRLRRTSTEPRRAGKRGKADPVDVPGGLCTDECTRNRPRQPGHNYAPFFLPQLAAGKDRHTMAQLAARGTPRRHPTIWELYLPRVRQRVSLAEPARAKGARRLQISGAVCCIAGPGRTGACGCKTCVRHHGTESPVHKIAIDGRQRPPRPASGRVSPTLRVRCSALLCRAAIEFTRGWQCAEAVELRGFCGKI